VDDGDWIMDYTTLTIAQIQAELEALVHDVQATFVTLDSRQLNWRPDATRWSVAQCFDHLRRANQDMVDAAAAAADPARSRTLWQRLPLWPGLLGRLLIRSQAPGGTRRFKAPPQAQPTASAIDPGVVARFIGQQRELVGKVGQLDEREAARLIMASPFLKVVTYSVLDGWRLIVAHEQRHVEQARRVTGLAGFPK
jgi:hypothetical protein